MAKGKVKKTVEINVPSIGSESGWNLKGKGKIILIALAAIAVAYGVATHTRQYLPRSGPSTDVVLVEAKKFAVVLKHGGGVEMRTGGSVAWRQNNPGRLVMGELAKKHGAVGEAEGYAVFPSVLHGNKALEELVFVKSKEKTVVEWVSGFVPIANQGAYLTKLLEVNNIKSDQILWKLDNAQKKKFLATIGALEGWTEGKVTQYASEEAWKAANKAPVAPKTTTHEAAKKPAATPVKRKVKAWYE